MFFDELRTRRRAVSRLLVVLALLAAGLGGCSDDTDGNNRGDGDAGVTIDAGADANGADTDTSGPDSGVDPGGDAGESEVDDVTDDSGTPPVDPPRDTGGGADVEEDTAPIELGVDAVTPSRGPVDGGTPFVIEGEGFSDDTAVYFGSRPAEVTRIEGNLVGEAPEGAGVGTVNVKLLDPTTGEAVLTDGYTYTETLEISAVSPERIPGQGGVEVSVEGRGFNADTRISFGGRTGLRHTIVDSELMRVVAPPHAPGVVDVRASNADGSDVLAQAATYFEAPRVDEVRPASGATAGGDSVTVYGAGFEEGMIVEFDGAPATVEAVDAGGAEASVVTPAGSEGLVDVRVETADGEATIGEDAFYYTAGADAFAVAAVEPATGPTSGGIEATLIGSGLDASGLEVAFGGQEATIVDSGPGHATVTIPSHAAGAVDVTISDGNGGSSTLSQAFTYVDDLWVDRIAPNSGDVAGGTTVSIAGEGFTGTQRVLFGGIAAPFSVDSDTGITATAPAHAAGVVDVVVERDIEATVVDGFTYTESLEVFGFEPVRGSVAGDTYVEIRGRGFMGAMEVEFGSEPASSVQIVDAQTLAVRTPPQASGPVDVTVTRGDDSVVAAEQYTYFNPGSRFGGSWGGPIRGAVNVTVYQSGGDPIEGAHVQLSTRHDSLYQGLTDASGMITLSGPDVFGEQTVSAAAPEHSSTTVQYVDAENVTIFLSPSVEGDPGSAPGSGSGPPLAIFEGNLSGLNKLAEPDDGEVLKAFVRTTRPDPWSQNPPPGGDATVFADGPYTLTSRIGDVALVALGGLYDSEADTFEPLVMGVERYLFASDGQVQTVDIELDIPLDQSLTFKLNNAPPASSGADITRVEPWLDFGFEGVFTDASLAVEDTSHIIEADTLPALGGDIADVEYWAVGGRYPADEGATFPFAEAFQGDISDMSQVVEFPVLPPLAQVTSPAAAQRPINGLVSFQTNSSVQADYYYIQVFNLRGQTVWEGFLNGDETSFRFPDFPDFSHLPADQRPAPYPGGIFQMNIFGIRQPGASINNYSYSDLSYDSWESYSAWAQFISF